MQTNVSSAGTSLQISSLILLEGSWNEDTVGEAGGGLAVILYRIDFTKLWKNKTFHVIYVVCSEQ